MTLVSSHKRVAAIDVGTNSVKLTVADVGSDRTLELIETARVPLQLGASVMRQGRFGGAIIELVAQSIQELTMRARLHGAVSIAIVATSAAREASDTNELQKAIRLVADVELEVISGEEEAVLSSMALSHRVQATRIGLVDVGGGSTEVALSHNGIIELALSVPIGAVRLKEACGTPLQFDQEQLQIIDGMILSALKGQLPDALEDPKEVFATGGTVTALAMLDRCGMPLEAARPSDVEDHSLTIDSITSISTTIAHWAPTDRVARSGLSAARIDVLVPGAMILKHVLEMLGVRVCRVHEQGLRSGLLLRLAGFS